MSIRLLITSVIGILIVILALLHILKKGRLNIKYTIVWLFSLFLLLLMLIIPGLLTNITKLLGFTLSSNLILVFFIVLLIFINISLTIIISGLDNKVRLLIQEISILKKDVENNDKRK